MRLKNRVFTVQNVEPLEIPLPLIKNKSKKGHSKIYEGSHYIAKWFGKRLKSFCDSTGLHGFNYVTSDLISSKEKFFWSCIVIVAIVVSILLVLESYTWNRKTPTVTLIESSHFAIWNIPFPALTLCNFNKISKSKAMTVAKEL